MQGSFLLQAVLLLSLLLAAQTASSRTLQHRLLTDNYDDGSEMNAAIIRDYLDSEECVRRCSSLSEKALLDSF